MELGRTASQLVSQELERFLLFSLLHQSPVNEQKKRAPYQLGALKKGSI
ncbi:hypothetical protein LOY85_27785 [Brevibacillus brevis]|nr:hypothetical protein [Brevibacillus brevis]UIO42544.1 hypothetical protein LOY85_27785 [Brevibacillus brevis]